MLGYHARGQDGKCGHGPDKDHAQTRTGRRSDMQFLVIMRMGNTKDPEIQRKRAELRDQHLARAAKFRDEGHVIIGGAVLAEDGTPAGSAAIAQFDTRAEVDAWLKDDPWTKAG